jgi:hypothetical protein
MHRLLPSEIEAEKLSELLADARAIPAAAYSRSKRATRRVLDLGALPVQRTAVKIPDATVSLLNSVEHRFADFSR